MVQKCAALAVSALILNALAVAGQDSASDKDKKALQGKWQIVSITVDDKTEAVAKGYIVFEGDKFKFTKKDFDSSGAFIVDAGKSPKALDVKKEKEVVLLCIYELKGDDLKLCCFEPKAGEKGKRPTEFTATASNEQTLIVLKRAK
jgi:uncharacterized protein (TIGR03067 family)